VTVGVEGLGSAGVPEAGLHGLDGLDVPDEQGRVVVPQAVERPALDARLLVDAAPQVAERRAPQQLTVGAGEDHPVRSGREAPYVLGERLEDDVGQRDGPDAAGSLRRSAVGACPRTFVICRSMKRVRRRKSMRSR